MRSAAHRTLHRWPWLLAAGVAVLCASTALASPSLRAGDRHGALTVSAADVPAVAFAVDSAADLTASPFHPLTRDEGVAGRITARDGAAFAYDLSGRRTEDDRMRTTSSVIDVLWKVVGVGLMG